MCVRATDRSFWRAHTNTDRYLFWGCNGRVRECGGRPTVFATPRVRHTAGDRPTFI